MWEVSWRRGQTATYWPQVLLTIAALLSHPGWAAQPWVTEGPSPLSGAGSHSASILSPLELTDICVLVIFLFDTHLLPVGVRICHHHRIQPRPLVKVIFRYLRLDAPVSLFFRLFTQVHLLIDNSVEVQYVTARLDFELSYFDHWTTGIYHTKFRKETGRVGIECDCPD